MSEEYPNINSLFGYSSGDPLGLSKFAEEERLRKEEEDRKYRESLLGRVWEPTKWFFDAAILKPAADVYRGLPEEVKQLSGAIPGVGAAQGISGLSALVGSTIDKPETESVLDIPDIQNIIGKEALEGPAVAAEQVAPVDVFTLGGGAGVSALSKTAKAAKLASGLSKAVKAADVGESLYGGALAGQGLAEGDLAQAGLGAFRMAMGGLGLATPNAKPRTSETNLRLSEAVEEPPNLKLSEAAAAPSEEVSDPLSFLLEEPVPKGPPPTAKWSDTFRENTQKLVDEITPEAEKILGMSPEFGGEGLGKIEVILDPGEGGGGAYFQISNNPDIPHQIALNPHLMRGRSPESLIKTILHEVTHRRTPRHEMGTIETERLAGLPPERTGELPLAGEGQVAEVSPDILAEHTRPNMEERAKITPDEYNIVQDEQALFHNPVVQEKLANFRERMGELERKVNPPPPTYEENLAAIQEGRPFPSEKVAAAPVEKPSVDELIEMAKAESQAKGITEPTNQAEVNAAHERMLEEVTEGVALSEKVISTPANILRQILDKTEMTTFNRNTLIEELKAKGYDVPAELKKELPGLLAELKDRGWVKEKLGGTYTLQATAPKTLGGIQKGKIAPGAIPDKALPKALEMSKELYEKPQPAPEKPKAPIEGEDIEISTGELPEKPIPLEQQMKAKLTPDEIKAIGNLFGTTKKKGTAEIPEEVLMAQKAAIKARAKGEKVTEGPPSEKVIEVGEKPPTAIEKAVEKTGKTIEESEFLNSPIVRTLNSMKSLAYGGDVGHMLRQGKQINADLLFSKHWRKVPEQIGVVFKSAKSQKFFDEFHAKLGEDPDIMMMVNDFNLDMPGLGKGLKEEAFHGGGLAEKAPIIGKFYARPSERAYTAGLNFLRAAETKKLIENLQKRGFTPETAPEKYRAVAKAVNVISQRGDFNPAYQKLFSDASAIYGAPRAKAARLQNAFELFRGGETGDIVRTTAAKTLAFNASIYGLLMATTGATFVTDPERSDFGKIRINDKLSIDPWMGLGVTARTVSKLVTGKSVSPYTGKGRTIPPSEALMQEFLGGIAPGVKLVWEALSGKDIRGYQVSRVKSLLNVTPMTAKSITELLGAADIEDALLLSLLQIGGEGVDVFDYEKARAEETELKKERGLSTGKTGKKRPKFPF